MSVDKGTLSDIRGGLIATPLSKKISEGMARAKESGKHVGRPIAICLEEDAEQEAYRFGSGTVVVTREQIQGCAKLGYSLARSARLLQVDSNTLRRFLRKKDLLYLFKHNSEPSDMKGSIIVPNDMEAPVESDEWGRGAKE